MVNSVPTVLLLLQRARLQTAAGGLASSDARIRFLAISTIRPVSLLRANLGGKGLDAATKRLIALWSRLSVVPTQLTVGLIAA